MYISGALAIGEGVPQGSILGPSLFLCYINDLKNIKFKVVLNLYADDSAITVAADNLDSLTKNLNLDLGKFVAWSNYNMLDD